MECVETKIGAIVSKPTDFYSYLNLADTPVQIVSPVVVQTEDNNDVFAPGLGLATGASKSSSSNESQTVSQPSTKADMNLTQTLTTTIGTAIGGPVGGAIGAIVGGLFGGSGEDTSATGFNTYMSSGDRSGVSFPTKAWLVAAAQNAGWPADNIAAIQSTYDQATGTGSEGDWKFAISSLSPVAVTFFKGSGEKFTRASNAVFTSPATAQSNAPGNASQAAQSAAFNSTPVPKSPPTVFGYAWYVALGYAVGIAVVLIVIGKLLFKRKR